MKVKQEDGTEIEVFTADEVAAQNATAVKEAEDAKKALAEANEALAKANDKDANFKALREQKEAAEKKATESEEKVKNLTSAVLTELSMRQINDRIKVLAGGDDELEKKIKFNLDRIKTTGGTPDELEKNLADALILSGVSKSSALGGAISSVGGPITVKPFAGEKGLKPELMEVAGKFGITAEDVEKFGKK